MTHPDAMAPTLNVRALNLDHDIEMFHRWAIQPRARFWGMTDKSAEEIREIYAFVDSLEAHWAWIVEEAGQPVGLLQTYEPEHDPIAEVYDVRHGDHGVHIFIAPGEDAARIAAGMLQWVFTDPQVQRIIAEPDARNERVLARFAEVGFEAGELVTLGEKTAQIVYLTRDRFDVA